MDAFISYANADRETANTVKLALAELGIASFMAHEDLAVSEEWREEIIRELNEVSIFVALLSVDSDSSSWCQQEVGFIISRPEVLVVPLSLDGTVPSGFISKLQAKRLSEKTIKTTIEAVLFRKRPRFMIPKWIKRVEKVRSFRAAEALIEPYVQHFPIFDRAEILAFLEAALENRQVWDAGDVRVKYLPAFAKLHWAKIPAPLKVLYRDRVEPEDDDI